MPTLYLVATPIGNLDDITLRALHVLRMVGLVAAEDTRTTRKLLTHYGIGQRLISYNDHNRASRIPEIIDVLSNTDVALVSEAGTPGISDPGCELVVAAIESGVRVVPVPGASAVLTALAVSGLPTRRFIFLGFLPRRRGERKRALAESKAERSTLVVLESPHRLNATLQDMLGVWGERRLAVARELTKLHEEVFRGVISEAIERFSTPRGEFTLVIEGAREIQDEGPNRQLETDVRDLIREGKKARQTVKDLAVRYGVPHREVYLKWLEVKREASPPRRKR